MFGFWDHHDRLLDACLFSFGEPVVVYPAGKNPGRYGVRGIYDAAPMHLDAALTVTLSNQSPWVAFRVLELPDAELPLQGMQVEVRAARWEIVDVEPDGGGHVFFRLLDR